VQPQDSSDIFCIETATGKVRWMQNIGNMCYLAGVDDGKVFVIEKAVMVLDVNTGKILQRSKEIGDIPAGRPAMTKTAIYISTKESLLKYDRQKGEIGPVLKWAEQGLAPGNLVFTEDAMYVVNAAGVVAFNGPGLAERLGKEVEKDPDNATLLYRYGAAMLEQKQYEAAVSSLEKAFSLAKPDEQYQGALLRSLISRSLYDCYIDFSVKSSADKKGADALKYANLACKYAIDEATRLAASVNLAGIYEKADEEPSWRAAIAAYQKIIADTPAAFSKFGGPFEQSAARYAANHIDAVIKTHGRAMYSEVEAAAGKELTAAKTVGSVTEYLKIFRQYPNSVAALEALTQAAKTYAGENARSMAIVTLCMASERFGKMAESAPANLMLYALSMEGGNHDMARLALGRLAAMPAELQAEIEGKAAPVSAYAEKKLKELDVLDDAPVGGAVGENPQSVRKTKLEDISVGGQFPVQNSIIAVNGHVPPGLADKIMILRGDSVECWNPATGEKVWANGGSGVWIGVNLGQENQAIIVVGVVAGQPAQAAGIQPRDRLDNINGKDITAMTDCRAALDGLKPGDKIKVKYTRNNQAGEVEVAVVQAPPLTAAAVTCAYYTDNGNLLLGLTDQRAGEMRTRCINGKTGETVWQQSSSGGQMWPTMRAARSLSISGAIERDNAGTWLRVVDNSNGKAVARVQLEQKNYMPNVLVGSDSVMIVEAGTVSVCHVYSILTGEEIFRMPMDNGNPNMNATPVALVGHIALYANENVIRAVNVDTGEVIDKEENMNSYALETSERYITVYRQGGNQATILDALENKVVASIKADVGRPFYRVSLAGDRLLILSANEQGLPLLNIYHARTGNRLGANIAITPDMYGRAPRIIGDYLIAMSAVMQGQRLVTTFRVRNYITGKDVFSVEREVSQKGGPAECAVINGQIYILTGDEIEVFK
jgi:outer membrane protein assembly factor BamB/tetratricopeptide (TPR) repeat protein